MINKNLANHSNVTLLKQNKKGEKMSDRIRYGELRFVRLA